MAARKKTSRNSSSTKKKAPKKKAPAKKKKKKTASKKKAPAKKKKASKKSGGKTVDAYVHGLGGWQKMVAAALRRSVSRAAPEAKESIKWGQPVYEDHGPFAYFKAFGNHINFGFWRGAELPDPHGQLAGDGDRMRHVQIRKPEELKPQYLEELIREAVTLNRQLGDPTKGK